MSSIVTISPVFPEPERIARAADIIRSGGVVVFPTTGLYGLAADATNKTAVDRVFEIKGRLADKPLSVLVKDEAALRRIVENIPAVSWPIIDLFWPGSVTIIFKAGKGLPANLTAGTGTIAVRLPKHPVAVALVRALAVPITATSANITGRKGCAHVAELDPALAAGADLVLNAGPVAGGSGSTIVDVTQNPPVIIREGAVPGAELIACIKGEK